jgi:GH24 family phage-related lysozyme (muramidase)
VTTLKLPDPGLAWPVPLAAVHLIAEAEGLRLKAYRCPAGIWTIGRGHTRGVRPGDVCTVDQADRWLLEDLQEFAGEVTAACTVSPTPEELGAMVSLAFNVGMGWMGPRKPAGARDGFRQSTVLRQHNAGNRQAAGRAFSLWNKARVNGVLTELPGLTARRAAEAAMYLSGDGVAVAMPQAVQAESSLAKSPINVGGVTALGTGLVAGLRELGDSIGGIKAPLDAAKAVMVDTLGVPPGWILPMVLIAAGALVIRWRLAQRRGGWA